MSTAIAALLAIVALLIAASLALLVRLDELEDEKRMLAERWRECMVRVIELETMLREKEGKDE